jgi:hypothetical protein
MEAELEAFSETLCFADINAALFTRSFVRLAIHLHLTDWRAHNVLLN